MRKNRNPWKLKDYFSRFGHQHFWEVGVVGIVLPVLPATPFVIVSAFCFGKSSKRFENWLSNNRYFGSYIENYKTKRGVPLDVKFKSIVFLWVTLIVSAILFLVLGTFP